MKTIKLKIKDFQCLQELKLFNSILRYSYNRFQEGLKEKEVRNEVSTKFKGNSWFIQCAIKEGKAVFEKFKHKKVIFGGKFNLKQYIKGLISKEDYCLNKLSPITIQGEASKKGNRLFNFDLLNSKIVLKLSKTNHKTIELPQLRNNLKKRICLDSKINRIEKINCNY